jgi:hypothetical protein
MNVALHRVFVLACLITAAAAGQIVDGSFEAAVAGGSTLPSPWTTSGSILVMPSGGCTSDPAIGFPSAGTKWVRIESGGGPATPSSYAGTPNVAQTFTTGTGGTQIHLDVAFSTGEGPGNTFYDDFMAVSVSTATATVTLLTIDTATGAFGNTACLTSQPATTKATIAADLATLFPGLQPTTPVILRIHCGNGGDNVVSSYAYVDNAYLGTPPPPPIALSFVNQGGGMWTLQVASPTHPNAECWNLFSLVTLTPTGSGPIFGINFDSTVLSEIVSPPGTHPFHIALDGNGNYSLGPIGLPAGLAADGIAIAVSGGAIVAVSTANKFMF